MKDLPKVFQNIVDKNFNNNETVFYSDSFQSNKTKDKKNEKNIVQKINSIFASPNYMYMANVEITLKDKVVNKRIIGRNKNYIITMDNELIPITDIVDINPSKK